MSRQPSALEQFTELGIPATDFTDAMRLAIKQKWSGLPVTAKVADLRDQLAALDTAVTQIPADAGIAASLVAAGRNPVTPDDVAAERARLKRNAAVNTWRERGKLKAALDARDLKFAALRAKRGKTVAIPAAVTGDPSPHAVAS